jgi:sortase B
MIDYPIVRATEYDYYLHRLPDGTFNANGTLFIDYNWKDFSDRFLIVYGHNMKSGRMFGSLSNYKRQEYFNAHPYLYLYTEQGEKYRIELMYGCVIGAGQWRDRAFMFDVNMDSLLAYAAHNTTFSSDIQYTQGDKIITLSTCSYEFDGARYVVIGVLRPEYH